MSIQVFLAGILLFFTAQTISFVVDLVVSNLANFFGYSVYAANDILQETEDTWVIIFYAGFLGPIVEEIVFRGVLLNGLKTYGKIFAIVTSSLLFAFFMAILLKGYSLFYVN